MKTNSNTLFKTLEVHFTLCPEVETTNYFILHWPYHKNEIHILITSICSIKSSTLNQNGNNIIKILIYGFDSLSETKNKSILNATMKFLISSKCFHFLFLIFFSYCFFSDFLDNGNWWLCFLRNRVKFIYIEKNITKGHRH